MEYAWYWLDDSKEWIEYGKKHPDHCAASITSEFLESEYQADEKAVIVFSAGSQQYKIDFADMVQTNLVFETRRNVIRLPKYLLPEGGQDKSQNTTLSLSTYPPEWDQSALPDTGFKLIRLSCDSQEHEKIKRLFEKTMKDYHINQIQRIQNPTLWEFFQLFVFIYFYFPYGVRRLTFPDLLSSIAYLRSCQIQQPGRGEAAMYLCAQVWLEARFSSCSQ
ncbi:protein mono-ADP-ribosyltransferase PARP12-like [Empidonax traillii]|uniref:protein mono-ADP-ribosyltransferase PARP12-like n=1 Tax=Empidonax traillii TaxID=164674 RepID=UPI000FFD4789|nr:protein mono-ADP-ribosyltransferase PARP12-like [Empidonax traillii]